MSHPGEARGISGRTVLIVFFALVGVMGGGLWFVLDANRDELVATRAGVDLIAPDSVPSPGWYRVTLESDDGPMPFLVEIPSVLDAPARIRNDHEILETELHLFPDGAMLLDFPHFDARVALSFTGMGEYEGAYTKVRESGPYDMPARMSYLGTDEPPALDRFAIEGEATADFTGRWKMLLDIDGESLGEFTQHDDGTLTGSIMNRAGSFGFVAGEVVGDRAYLSTFNGSHAFLFTASMSEDGSSLVDGVFNSGGYFHDTFVAERLAEDDPYMPLNPFDAVTLKPGETRLGLEQLREEPYVGAPTIVVAFGTWCPNCHSEAPHLKALYDTYHEQGLEVLGLAYERNDDHERSMLQIERFKERYGISWNIIPAGTNDKSNAASRLPELSSFKSYPTTIFINRDGTVEAIHSGFASDISPELHEEQLAEMERQIQQILASE
ncbi:MAG: TlpA disulfide reductase family protein [Planctomycetota bacterium]|jgi:thiol-disulfide isomerase/thioredoxin